ncbi:hypothetical protein [Deinococcus kurensis]|uniref:hypothetical protein n=1 Tax=Deinococcus kurensis TaxID=2662757 RepID=UPI0012D34A6A|nr:hypothetical protein [Deinococcus kurensis]
MLTLTTSGGVGPGHMTLDPDAFLRAGGQMRAAPYKEHISLMLIHPSGHRQGYSAHMDVGNRTDAILINESFLDLLKLIVPPGQRESYCAAMSAYMAARFMGTPLTKGMAHAY